MNRLAIEQNAIEIEKDGVEFRQVRVLLWHRAKLIFSPFFMDNFRVTMEEFKVLGKELVDKVQEMIHAGNVRRIIIRDEHGHTFMEIPLTVAAIGTIAAPVLAAVGAIAAHLAKFTIVVERVKEEAPPTPPAHAEPKA